MLAPSHKSVLYAASGLLLILFANGCSKGGGNTVPKGVVLKDGAPYPAKELGGEFGLSFVAVQADGSPGAVFMAEALDPATGAFEVTGPTSKGIPAGKYKIQVKHIIAGKTSPLPAEFATFDSPLEVTITESPAPMKIDLGKAPSVTLQ